ncbi:MAG: thrombospondin type 3 repeat-containing protein [Sulfurimonas sp.]|jgi:hypothetical protein
MRKALFSIFFVSTLHAEFINDADLDGVEDAQDKCPNTPFSDLIDTYGCTIQTLYTQTSYDIIMGIDLSRINSNTLENTKTSNATFQADVYHGGYSAQLFTSYFQSEKSPSDDYGWNDTQLNFFYAFKPLQAFTIQTGIGVILPTYSSGYHNEATDYRGNITLKYTFESQFNLFGAYTYTLIKDKRVPRVTDYQNTYSFYGGIGYTSLKNNSLTLSYSHTESIYTRVVPIEMVSIGTFIPLNNNWFVLGDYHYGVSASASDHDVALRVGYTF